MGSVTLPVSDESHFRVFIIGTHALGVGVNLESHFFSSWLNLNQFFRCVVFRRVYVQCTYYLFYGFDYQLSINYRVEISFQFLF